MNRRAVARKAIAVVFGIITALLLFATVEATFRLVEPSHVQSDAIAGGVAIEDPVTGWRLRPDYAGLGPDLPGVRLSYQVRINHAGFRGGLLTPDKPTDAVRIAALGDSVTFGFGVAEEDTYPVIVAGALSNGCRRHVEAINAGVPGFTSLQGVHYVDRVLSYHPDIVTVLYGWNDGWRTTESYSARTSVAREIVESSRVLTCGRRLTHEWMGHFASNAAATSHPAFPFIPPEDFERNLLEIADRVRRAGAIPVLITAPAAFGPDRPPPSYFQATWIVPRAELEPTWRRYADVVRHVAEKDAIPIVDGARLVPSDPKLFLADGYHPNAAGQHALAEQIIRAMQKLGPLVASQY
jgi:lysophospholipase L1-like esterase